MRLNEIVTDEVKLALWHLISDKVWSTFGQTPSSTPKQATRPVSTPVSSSSTHKQVVQQPKQVQAIGAKATQPRAAKARRVPMAPAPKPLPKAKPLPKTTSQVKQAQSQQNQQLAQHIQKALAASPIAQASPKAIQPKRASSVNVPINNSYDARDKDELVFHSRASNNPLKPLEIKNR